MPNTRVTYTGAVVDREADTNERVTHVSAIVDREADTAIRVVACYVLVDRQPQTTPPWLLGLAGRSARVIGGR